MQFYVVAILFDTEYLSILRGHRSFLGQGKKELFAKNNHNSSPHTGRHSSSEDGRGFSSNGNLSGLLRVVLTARKGLVELRPTKSKLLTMQYSRPSQ